MDDWCDDNLVHLQDRRALSEDLDLESVATSLRSALLVGPDEETAHRHLAAMASAGAWQPAGDTTRARAGRGRRARRRLAWSSGISCIALAFSGVAAAGALPGGAQHDVSRVAAIIRVHVPDTAPKASPTPHPAPATTAAPATPTPAPSPNAHNRSATSTSTNHVKPPSTNRGHHGTATEPKPEPPHRSKPPSQAKPPKPPKPTHTNHRTHPHKPRKKKHHRRKKPIGKKHHKPAPPPFGSL
jgi:hypothetical protein